MFTRVAVAISIVCLVFPAVGSAQRFAQGDKELLLTGTGVSDEDFDSTVFAIDASLGYFFTDNIEGAIRQGAQFSHLERGGSSWSGRTRVAADYHWDMGRVWPFAGASLGLTYGDDVPETGTFGPEAGVKIFVNDTTFILGMIEFAWFFDDDDDEDFDDGQWLYTVGVGFRWQ